MTEPIRDVETAVRELGALPMPVGPEPQPLSAERLDEIRSCQPDGWLEAPWMFAHVETDGDEPAYIRVFEVASGTTVATLPDWAGNLAMWIADAREAMPELLAEVARLTARVAELEAWKAADEQVQPHREATATANMHHIAHLELRLRRARFLHVKQTDSEHCQHDGEKWPCPTVAALDAPVGEATHPCGCPKRFARHADGCPTAGGA